MTQESILTLKAVEFLVRYCCYADLLYKYLSWNSTEIHLIWNFIFWDNLLVMAIAPQIDDFFGIQTLVLVHYASLA